MSNETPNLSQSDFRKLLQTPRAPASGESQPSSTGVLGKRRMTHRQTPKAKPTFVPRKRRPAPTQAHGTEKYRDRAAERRQTTADPDEPHTADTTAPVLHDAHMASEQQRLYEQSKHLGGDSEHTHLVKGLDYLLLEKMRTQRGECELDAEIERLQDGQDAGTVAGPTSDAQTSLGKRVMDALAKLGPQPEHNAHADMFLPGRMYFEFSLTSRQPTTVRVRSQDEIAQMLGVSSLAGLDQRDVGDKHVIDKVVAAIAMRNARMDSESVRDETCVVGDVEVEVVAPEASVGDGDEDDIFAGAGVDYDVGAMLPPSDLSGDSGSDDEAVVEPYPASADEDEVVVEPYPASEEDEMVVEPYPVSEDE
ncbi:hypothetical protein IW147_000639 [Coemansia sp. RSA 720]|nr:hypothetical protein IW147_000639 [Coemansia sp. RSA 720]